MEERRFMNGTGRGGLICVALLLFILAGSGVAHAATDPGEDVRFNPMSGETSQTGAEDTRQTVLAKPADTVAYGGAESAYSIFYNPVHLGCALGAVIVLAVGYVLIRRFRGKDAP
ncbi:MULTISPECIES: hypothetical protein [unclassified Methanoculleus]|uniref:hypothetical protein n=1 Tax=unclassified Methanoculleus TaxID=2619537 RepID=UPI0025DFA98F|nr:MULTISPECIES: hypothetical protein [unclassified Methanoculleus]